MARDYPQRKYHVQGKNMTRVYTLDAKKAIGNNDLIADTCHLNNQSLLCIVLCGATHSFISVQCMECL